MEQSNMFNGKWQNFELSSFWLTFRFVTNIWLEIGHFLVICWLQNEKFPSKMISHSFESLTIKQITILRRKLKDFYYFVFRRTAMVICSMVSDSKLWEIIFEVNFSFFSQNMTRNWTFDKFNLLITSEASFKEG